MPRRRTEPKPRPKPFVDAFGAIDKMEDAVIYRTVTCNFAPIDAARWLWPDTVVDALLEAFSYTKYRNSAHSEGPLRLTQGGIVCTLYFRLDDALPMLAPAPGLVHLNPDRGQPIVDALSEVAAIHDDFNIVRTVVRWMNNNCTPGAARFYLPALTALLPPGHPVNQADGQRYQEPGASMADISPLIRRAGAIIASGLLADPGGVDNMRKELGVNITTQNDEDEEGIVSQRFMLL